MNATERSERLYKEAEKQGLDAPTESMLADAMTDHADQQFQEILAELVGTKFADAAKHLVNVMKLEHLEDAI